MAGEGEVERMARTPVPAKPSAFPSEQQPRLTTRTKYGAKAQRSLRFWYVPLLLAVLLPLLLWAGLNLAVVIVSNRDLGTASSQPDAAPTPAPDQPLLDAAIGLVQATACAPAPSAIQVQAALAGATWSARRSEADSHAYYVAAADPTTARLLGIWQVEGGAVMRLQDDHCPDIPAGPPARLAEAAVLFSPHRLGAGTAP
jgi:hypothetical protein